MGKKVGFASVFTDITRRGTLSEEATIHTAKMTEVKVTLKEIHKRWVIYTDSQSSLQSIEYNKEYHPILNQIYITSYQNSMHKTEKIILCKVPTHIGIKGNKKTEKQAIDMLEMTTRLPYTNYYWPTGRLETLGGIESGK